MAKITQKLTRRITSSVAIPLSALVVGASGLFGSGTAAGDYLGMEPSGLAIDFAQNSALVRDPLVPVELVTNGDFAVDANWTKGTGWTIAAGVASNSGSIGTLTQSSVLTVGKSYTVEFDIVAVSNWVVGPDGVSYTTTGRKVASFVASGTGVVFAIQVGGHTVTIDNVSVKQVNTAFSGLPVDLLTYTSPSPKMVYGSDGILRYARHNYVRAMNAIPVSVPTSHWNTQLATTDAVSMTELDGPTVTPSAQYGNLKTAITTVEGVQYIMTGEVFVVSGNTALDAIIEDSATAGSVPIAGLAVGQWVAFSQIFLGKTGGGNVSAGVQDRNAAGRGSFKIRKLMISNYPMHPGSFLQNNTTAARYDMPLDYDPVTLAAKGVLIEEQRTNLFLQSRNFATTWIEAGLSTVITANAVTGPDELLSAALITDTAAGSANYGKRQDVAVVSGTAYCASWIIKKRDYRYEHFNLFGTLVGYFDLDTGVATKGGATGAGMIALGNGWYWCWVVGTAGSTGTLPFYIIRSDTSGTSTHTGVLGTGNYYWDAQLEAGVFPSSYILTVASQVTRAVDQITLVTSAYPNDVTQGTYVLEFDAIGYNTNHRLLDCGANYRWFYQPIVPTTVATYNGTTAVTAVMVSPVNREATVSMAYDAAGTAICDDGDTPGTNPAVFSTNPGALNFGSAGFCGHIKRIKYLPRRATNSELQAMAA